MDAIVTGDWLEARLDDPALRVLDCSVRFEPPLGATPGRQDWEAAHVPGAIFVDHFEIADSTSPVPLAMPPAEELARALGSAGVGDGTYAVIYDRTNGMWAARLWWMLRAISYDDAAILDGGWHAWTAEGRPVTADVTPLAAATLTPRPRPNTFVDARAVLESVGHHETAIVSALETDAHERGLYGRPGFIPSSRCVPFSSLIDPDTNRLVGIDTIRERFAPEMSTRKVITYCGGGIAASLAALALHVAGHEQVAVYDGSLLEWCANPDLPLEP